MFLDTITILVAALMQVYHEHMMLTAQFIKPTFKKQPQASIGWKERILDDVMWVDIPLLNAGHQLLECVNATVMS